MNSSNEDNKFNELNDIELKLLNLQNYLFALYKNIESIQVAAEIYFQLDRLETDPMTYERRRELMLIQTIYEKTTSLNDNISLLYTTLQHLMKEGV